jgi:hypothetical protein
VVSRGVSCRQLIKVRVRRRRFRRTVTDDGPMAQPNLDPDEYPPIDPEEPAPDDAGELLPDTPDELPDAPVEPLPDDGDEGGVREPA